jgi:hypothetical protein
MTWVVLAAVVAGLAVVYLLLRARVDRRISRLDPAAEVRDELGSVMVEMNRTTDRNIALLEDRIAALTQLIADADRRIGLLRREGEKQELSRAVYTHLSRAAERASEPAAVEPPVERPADRTPAAPAAAGPVAPAAPAALAAPAASIVPAEEPIEARVLRLEREGFSSSVIANRIGSTVGEVELIISLARRRT